MEVGAQRNDNLVNEKKEKNMSVAAEHKLILRVSKIKTGDLVVI